MWPDSIHCRSLPLSIDRSSILDLFISLTFNGYFTSIKLISARTPANAIALRQTTTRRSPSMLQSNWFPSYLSCSVWMKTIAWPIESTSLYRPRGIFPLFKHVRSMIVEQINCISLVRGEKKIDERHWGFVFVLFGLFKHRHTHTREQYVWSP